MTKRNINNTPTVKLAAYSVGSSMYLLFGPEDGGDKLDRNAGFSYF
jgi:hypothetical protein